jgi:hypothetical protein
MRFREVFSFWPIFNLQPAELVASALARLFVAASSISVSINLNSEIDHRELVIFFSFWPIFILQLSELVASSLARLFNAIPNVLLLQPRSF